MKSHQRGVMKSHQRKGKNSHRHGGKTDNSHGFIDGIKFVVAIAVLFTASIFAYASFVSSACVDTENQCLDADRGFFSKLYFSENSARYAKLTREISSESKGFEFMVWDRERTNLSKALLSLQHQRINLQPLNDELWIELNYFDHNARVTHSERSWALNRSEEIVGWNHEQSAKLVHYCVNEYELYGQVITSSCVSRLINLPGFWNLDQLANKAELSTERLTRARAEAMKNRSIEAP